ncbi:hypothetical protein [Herbihabitans rhizosphaerae]|uniref:hypothetical protein n=1 Tax=Herbihabitans rhizosphaerae TaxID=1872711 RepID=UPI00102C8372|nr:hypothetical protein [Herbihabitans rhizosphaerae]
MSDSQKKGDKKAYQQEAREQGTSVSHLQTQGLSAKKAEYLQGQALRPVTAPGANYPAHSHQELWDMVQGGDPASVREMGDAWVRAGQNLIRYQRTIGSSVEGGQVHWKGQAATQAGDFATGVANWVGQSGSGAYVTGTSMREQSEALNGARTKMPPPTNFNVQQANAKIQAAPPEQRNTVFAEQMKLFNEAKQAHLRAADVATSFDGQTKTATYPTMAPPPTMAPTGGSVPPGGVGDGQREGTGTPIIGGGRPGGGSTPRTGGNGTGTSGVPGIGTPGAVPPGGSPNPTPTDGTARPPVVGDSGTTHPGWHDPTRGPGHGPVNTPGQQPTSGPGGGQNIGLGGAPLSPFGPGVGGGEESRRGAGGGRGAFGPLGSGGTGERGAGMGPRAGAVPGGMPGEPHATGRAGGAAGAGRGGAGGMGMPLGGGAGRPGDDDDEHDRPTWLVDPDPDMTWHGEDYPALPPSTIGED